MLRADLGVIAESEHDTSVHVRLHEDIQRHLDLISDQLLFDEAQTAIHLGPEVDLLRGSTAFDVVL